jgi:hypothetical protein
MLARQYQSQRALEIVQRYGAVLETSAPASGRVADVTRLPFPKDEIKEALIVAMKATSDSKTRDMLKCAYIQLADWQVGVGDSDVGLDMSKVGSSDDIEKQAQQILAMSDGHERWGLMAVAEGEMLKKELDQRGLW